MRFRVAAGLVFALLMFLIPLLALVGNVDMVQYSPAEDASAPQAAAPAGTGRDAPETDSPAPAAPAGTTPAVAVADDGFRVLDERTGKVFEVSARDYVRGALAAEMPPTFHPEALKAQAVAAHTYALRLKEQNRAAPDETLKGADFSADPQGWKSYTTEALFRERYGELADAYWKAVCGAADEACPYLLTWEGEPIVAAYHSMSSGTTEDASNVWTGSEPYLVPVESFGDTLAPDYETTERFPVQEVAEKLQNAWPGISLGEDPAGWLRVTGRSEGGYVTGMTAGDRAIHGKELRSLLGLRSSDFTVACDGAFFTFTVRGYGHGVGLSQYGADYMARQGATFDEILAHYYPGAALGVIAGGAAS
ncbi:stage II sporulation protein D [uncultured Anaerotruncus sp.]|uniref:stage II sporulation protein D n=1 Tax=uncultured Anaerotruncus sp. TaxID=905011 RepID=UPI00280AF01C|nr:stage II sporulation protein D [uncultured Anaerotruncus sp.]